MRWFNNLKRQMLGGRPILRATNPRLGTAVIPLDLNDKEIFFQYLNNRIHSLYFEGSSSQLESMIQHLQTGLGFKIEKMRITPGRGQEKFMYLHLRMNDEQELRRVIKLM